MLTNVDNRICMQRPARKPTTLSVSPLQGNNTEAFAKATSNGIVHMIFRWFIWLGRLDWWRVGLTGGFLVRSLSWFCLSPAALSLFVLALIILWSCRCQNRFCSKFLDPVFLHFTPCAGNVQTHTRVNHAFCEFDQICKCLVDDVLPVSFFV